MLIICFCSHSLHVSHFVPFHSFTLISSSFCHFVILLLLILKDVFLSISFSLNVVTDTSRFEAHSSHIQTASDDWFINGYRFVFNININNININNINNISINNTKSSVNKSSRAICQSLVNILLFGIYCIST